MSSNYLTHGTSSWNNGQTAISHDSQVKTYTFKTGQKYVDKDIAVTISAKDGIAGNITGGGLTHGDTTLSSGGTYISTTSSDYGPIQFNNLASRAAASYSITTPGWIDDSGVGLAAIVDDPKPSDLYYVKAAKTPSLACDDQATTDLTVGTLTSGYYPFTTSITGKTTYGTAGWIPTGGLTEATDSSVTVGRIPAVTFKNTNKTSETATDGRTYTDISSSAPVLVENDYLYITAGYTPNVKISLAKLVPDGVRIEDGATSIADGMLNTFAAYNNNGELITGNIAKVTPQDNATVPSQITANTLNRGTSLKIPKGYIAQDYYYTAQADAHSSYTPNSTYFTKTAGTTTGTGISEATIKANQYASSAHYIKRGSVAINSPGINLIAGEATFNSTSGKYNMAVTGSVEVSATTTNGWVTPTEVTPGTVSASTIDLNKATFSVEGASVECSNAGWIGEGTVGTIASGSVTASANITGVSVTGATAGPYVAKNGAIAAHVQITTTNTVTGTTTGKGNSDGYITIETTGPGAAINTTGQQATFDMVAYDGEYSVVTA